MTDVEAASTAAHALAAELGLTTAPVTVLADRSNLALALGPTLVARVAMATSLVRVGMEWLRREVEVTRYLDRAGVGVTRPVDGPFERAGFVISFWERERLTGAPPDPVRAGAALRRAHEALARSIPYPDAPRAGALALPPWGGFEEARAVLDRARGNGMLRPHELARVDRAWDAAERVVRGAPSRSASMQAVHGDAHIGNVLATERGVLWTDWEDAFLGPVEFDLACLRSRAVLFGEDVAAIDTMTAAYGPHDRDLVADLALVRNVQVIPWLAVFAERDPSLLPRMRARIERLP